MNRVAKWAWLTSAALILSPQADAGTEGKTEAKLAASVSEPARVGRASLNPAVTAKNKIEGLDWRTVDLEVEETEGESSGGKKLVPAVKLRGLFARKNYKFMNSQRLIPLSTKQGEFELKVELVGPKTFVKLRAVGPLGELELQTIEILYPSYAQHMNALEGKDSSPGLPVRYRSSIGLGISAVQYKETAFRGIYQIGLTLKGGYSSALSEGSDWKWGVNGYGTAMPLTTDEPGFSMRFFGANLRFGRELLGGSDYSLVASTGLHYTTTYTKAPSANLEFGFSNMVGPQLFVNFARLSPTRAYSIYAKFCPLFNGLKLNTSNRELAAGGSVQLLRLSSGNPLSLTIDASEIDLDVKDVLTFKSTSFSAGIQTNF